MSILITALICLAIFRPHGIICDLKAVWRRIRYKERISGHDWIEEEVHKNCTVYISRCKNCGEYDISWREN